MTPSPNHFTSTGCRTRQARIATRFRWQAIFFVAISSFGNCNSWELELEQSLPYRQLPHLHPGVQRDFEALLLQQEQRKMNHPDDNKVERTNLNGITSVVEKNVIENPGQQPDRSLQNEIAFCYDALYLADENQDNKVDGDEFVTFARIMGPPGFLPNSNNYQELPLILQSNFIILACLCLQIPNFDGESGINPQCCAVDPHIDISGTQPGQIPTSKQSQYLYQVCFLTETSIDRLLLSATPTPEPSNPPAVVVVTDRPTDEPSRKPSKPPSEKPSIKLTSEPTNNPTGSPTLEPTFVPTRSPTSEPTPMLSDKPSASPTEEPSQEPIEKPTNEPTTFPTRQPTDTPTTNPTAELSRNPTGQPSGNPTEMLPSTTLGPTISPSLGPTESPSTKPSLEGNITSSVPTEAPSEAPSLTPTISPTTVNDTKPVTEVAIVNYGIAITNGRNEDIPSSMFVPDLIQSMDIVVEDVAYGMDVGERENGRSLRQYKRELATIITVNLPTAIDSLTDAECPSFVSPNDECQTVTASVELNIAIDRDTTMTSRQFTAQELTDSTAVKDLFQESLTAAIENGALQAALIEVNPNSVVTITTGVIPESPTSSPTLTTSKPITPAPTSEPVPISPGGIIGIVLAGVGGLIIGFLIIAALRRKGSEASVDDSVNQYQDVEEAGLNKSNIDASGADDLHPGQGGESMVQTNKVPVGVVAGAATAGAVAAIASSSEYDESQSKISDSVGSPGKKKRQSDALYEVPGAKNMVIDDASSAGESGWSSNQDGSSANTSIDNSLDSIPQSNFSGISPIVLGASVEREIRSETAEEASSSLSPARPQPLVEQEQTDSVAQSISPSTSRSPQSQIHSQDNSYSGTTGTEGSMQSTYSELDEAIQKGDWAAVGVTAALLASQAYVDDNTQGSSKQSSSRLRRHNSTLNPERAAELDRLVESGDWEGVVAAAAKFDAQEALRGDAHSSQNSESGSAVSSAGGSNNSSALSGSPGGGSSIGTAPSNMSGSNTIDTTTSPSTFTATGLTATSDTASTRSKARKLNEIRDEVEALVTAVVPEEADNVDEMMTQFRGREEELVETLRSMQERQVAQKARKESQKQAKRQAKEYMQDKKKQETFEAVDNTGNSADDIWMKEIENSAGERNAVVRPSSDLNEETEAMKDQLKEAINNENWENVAEAAAGLSGHTFSKAQLSSKDSESGSVDINALVDKGDWDGVVAAASRYAESSTNASTSNEYTREDTEELADDSTIEERRKRREERLREEEEALAQAQIWDAIADQTKVDDDQEKEGTASNAGAAKMAADWAIDQSLAALQKAEEEIDDDSQDSSQDKKGDNESL